MSAIELKRVIASPLTELRLLSGNQPCDGIMQSISFIWFPSFPRVMGLLRLSRSG